MAISINTPGTWAVSNATTQTVTLPTHAAGDMLIVRALRKPFTNPDDIVCNTAGWAAVGTGVANGSTANGNGTGSMAFKAFYKIAASSSETNPVVTWGTTSAPGAAVAISYQKGAGETWITPTGTGGGDATARTSQTSTMSSHISVTAGDMVDFFRGQCDDSGALTVPTITQTGVTFAAVTEAPAAALLDGTSNDIAADGGYRLATAGTSSAAAVITGTSAASEQHGAWQTRLRVFTPETHSGSVTGSGGGVAVTTGQKKAATSITGTAGGVATVSVRKAGQTAITATAGGIATVTQTTNRARVVTATAGGTATLAQTTDRAVAVAASAGGIATITCQVAETHFGSLVATGGGIAVVSASTDRSVTVSGTAGGVATLTQATERAVTIEATGAGVATLEGFAGRGTTIAATGGGTASLSVTSARLAASLMSGGGVMTELHSTERFVTITVTGGGIATVSGTSATGATGSVTATGGGIAVITAIAGRQGLIAATGAGAATVTASGAHTGSVTATGGGTVTIVAGVSGELPDITITSPSVGITLAPTHAAISLAAAQTIGIEVDPL